MRIVLADDVVGLGDIGDTVNVKPGYARNFLIPRGKAFEADGSSAKVLAHRMTQIEAKKRKFKTDAEKRAQKVRELELLFEVRVGRGGKLFGSIGQRDVADALAKKGFVVDRRRVMLQEPIRKLGTHFVAVKLHPDVSAQLKVQINGSAASQAEEEAETEEARENLEEAADEREESAPEE